MSFKNLLILLLVIVLVAGLAAGATFLYFVWQETMPKLTPAAKPDETKAAEEPLFPTGEAIKPEEKPAGRPSTTTEEELGIKTPRLTPLVQLAARPVAGFFLVGSSTATEIIYADRASGHIYTIAIGSGDTQPRRLSNTTIPKIYELSGGKSNSQPQIIARYLKNNLIQNFSANLSATSSEPAALEGKFLSPQIYSLAVAPDQNKIFYLERAGGETKGVTANFDDSKKTAVFSSPFNSWLASWPNLNTVALKSKTSSRVPGSLYFLNLKDKTFTKVISGVPGLTANVSPNLKKVAYSAIGSQGVVFGLYEIKERVFGRLPFKTLAEKCVWNKEGGRLFCAAPADLPARPARFAGAPARRAGGPPVNYPEDWYSGEVTLNDRFWQVDAADSRARLVFEPTLAGQQEELDVSQLMIDSNESFLVFINKKDLSLWLLNLKEGF